MNSSFEPHPRARSFEGFPGLGEPRSAPPASTASCYAVTYFSSPLSLPRRETDSRTMHFQDLILTLQSFWAKRGCLIVQPYNSEVGAGTYNPATFLRALGPEPWNVAFVEPSRRPTDGRYGDNPNRTAAVSPVPGHPQAVARSTSRTSTSSRSARSAPSPSEHDVRFVEDDWESPTLGAWGLGWQVWLDGLEISPVHLLPAGRRHRLPARLRRAHLRPRAHRDVPAGRRVVLRRAVGARRHATASSASAPSGSGRRTTSSRPT